jgi:hypothetical protein
MKPSISLLLALGLCIGCKQTPTCVVVTPWAIEPPGTYVSETSDARRPPLIKSYQLGPHIDPKSPRVLHREHEILVEEAPASWRVAPKSVAPRSPSNAVLDSAYTPQRTPDEFLMRLREMGQIMQLAREQSTNIDLVMLQFQSVTNLIVQVIKRQVTLEQRTRLLEEELARPVKATNSTPTPTPPKQRSGPDPW